MSMNHQPFTLRIFLKHKKCLKQRNLGLDVKHETKDRKGIKNSKKVGWKLGRDNPEKIKDIDNKGMKRKSNTNTKEFLVHDKTTRQTSYYLAIWSKDMDMDRIWELIKFLKSKNLF